MPYAIETASNTDCEFYEISGQSENQVTLAKLTGTIEAGRSIVLHMLTSADSLEISSVGEEIYVTNIPDNAPNGIMLGTFEETMAPRGSYVIADSKFTLADNLASDAAKVGAFHGYVPAEAIGSTAAELNIVVDDTTSAIDRLNDFAGDPSTEYYDTEGHRIDGLRKGVNIIKNGNRTFKVVIK